MEEKKCSKEPEKKKQEAIQQGMDAVEDILQQFTPQKRRHISNENRTSYGEKWKANDVLCCLINTDEKYIEFFLNNKSMGIAFKNIEFDGNIYISITLGSEPSHASCILLNHDAIDINDESKWDIEGNMDTNDNAKRIEMLKKITYDDQVIINVDELKEGDKVVLIQNDEIIESEIERINTKTRKILIRNNGWKWISMDSNQLFPSKDAVNNVFDEINKKTTKLGRKFSATEGFPTATLKIAVNSLSATKNGEFKYNVLIGSNELMQIGFSDDSFKPNDVKGDGCGDDNHSWAFDGDRVLKWGKRSEESSEEDKKKEAIFYKIIPKEFIYDYQKDYSHAIRRALYATRFDLVATLKWFAAHWKDENIYLPITNDEFVNIMTSYKEKGNTFYKSKKYYQAITEYDKAIWYGNFCDSELYICYSNRSIALSKVHEYELALYDANQCILLNRRWSKGYLRKGYALMKLRRFDESIAAYKEGIKICDKNEHKLLNIALNTAIKYKEIMLMKKKEREKIKFIICPLPTEENMKKRIEEEIKKVYDIHINYNKMYTFNNLITFDTFGWNLVENNNENENDDEKKRDMQNCNYKVWKCDNYPAILTIRHYKKQCDIKKKPIDVNMFSIRHIQRDNLLKSGVDSGLMLSENFEICKEATIYAVEVLIKTIIVTDRPSSGYIYWIKIPFKNEYFELKLETTYRGQMS